MWDVATRRRRWSRAVPHGDPALYAFQASPDGRVLTLSGSRTVTALDAENKAEPRC